MARQPLFDRIDERVSRDLEDSDYGYFFALTFKLEYLTKIVTSSVIACIGEDAGRLRYRLECKLVRADSIGAWVEMLNDALLSGLLIPEAHGLRRDLTQKVGPGAWQHKAVDNLNRAAQEVGVETKQIGNKNVPLQQFFKIGVELRNRSRGHGAPTAGQCGKSCPYLKRSLDAVTQKLEIFRLPWVYLHRKISKKYRVSPLLNDSSSFDYLKKTHDEQRPNGVFFGLNAQRGAVRPVHPVHVPLIFSNPDLTDIALPNGNYSRNRKTFETLSYVTNEVVRKDGAYWLDPPYGVFNGFQFEDGVFHHPEGSLEMDDLRNRILRLAMEELRKRDDLREMGIDPQRPGRRLRDDEVIWDVLVFAVPDEWRASLHLTIGVGREYVTAMATLPNKALAKYRQPLTALGEQGLRLMAGKVLENMRPLLEDCPGMEPRLRFHHRRQPPPLTQPRMAAALDMDLQTCIDDVDFQHQWIDALRNRRSKPEVQIGARFPYRTCPAIAETRSLDFVARAWIACKPYIDVLFGSQDTPGAP